MYGRLSKVLTPLKPFFTTIKTKLFPKIFPFSQLIKQKLHLYKNNPKELIRALLIFTVVIIAIIFGYKGYRYTVDVIFARPVVIGSVPQSNDIEVPLDSNISITFSRPMNKESVESLISLEPNIEVETKWDGNTLILDPKNDFIRDQQISLSIKKDAQATNYRALESDINISFTAISNPNIAMAAPTGSITEPVENIVVMFNKSIKKPEGEILKITPEVTGERKWIGSAAYMVKPENLVEGQTYTVEVIQDLESLDGGSLEKGYFFKFVNFAPAILHMTASTDAYRNAQTDINPRGTISVYFNQVVDQASVLDKLSFTDALTQENVPYTTRFSYRPADQESDYYYQPWQKQWKYKLEITPRGTLDDLRSYFINIDGGFLSATGNAFAEYGRSFNFTTANSPGFISSNIINGTTDVGQNTRLELTFKSPMSAENIKQALVVRENGVVINEDFFISAGGPSAYFNKYLARSTNYNFYLPASTKDAFGRPLGEEVSISFTTAPYKPAISIVPQRRYFTNFSSSLDSRIVTRVVNTDSLDLTLYKLNVESFLKIHAMRRDSWNSIDEKMAGDLGFSKIGTYNIGLDLVQDIHTDVLININKDTGLDLDPGFYFIDIGIPGVLGAHDNIAFVVGDTSVTSKKYEEGILVWATSLSERSVKKGAEVKVYEIPYDYPDVSSSSIINNVYKVNTNPISQGKTNDDGVFTKNYRNNKDYLVVVEKDGDLGITFSDWSDGIGTYAFGNVSYGRNSPKIRGEYYKGYVVTDRTLYRPGQTVHFNAFIRNNEFHTYTPVTDEHEIRVELTTYKNYKKVPVMSEVFSTAETDNFSGKFELSDGMVLGRYSVELLLDGTGVYTKSFDVQEYELPEFEVTVDVPEDILVRNNNITLDTDANYFYGVPVSNSNLDYRLFKRNYIFSYPEDRRYSFYSRREYYGDNYIWRGFEEEEVLKGTSSTDNFGKHVLNVNATTDSGISQIFTYEADVLGESGNKFSGSDEYIVHMADHYTGVKSNRYIGRVDENSKFEVLTITPKYEEVKDVDVNVNVYLRKYFRVKKKDNSEGYLYETTYEDDLVYNTKLTTNNDGEAQFEFTPKNGGTHIVEVESFDDKGNRSVSDKFFYVSSNKPGYWRRENHDRVDLILDKDEYKVGDSAKILTTSTIEEGMGLLTIEAEGILYHDVFKQDASGEVQEFEISDKYIPNAYVSVMLVSPGIDLLNPPEFKIGVENFTVDTTSKNLKVELSTPKENYSPKEKGEVTVRVLDSNNNPVSNANLTGALVDDALMSIASLKRKNAFEHFYSPRQLGINTSQSLTTSLDRINLNTEIGAKGGSGSKGGAGGEYVDLTRTDFSETAVWLPVVKTDSNGYAKIPFELPDSITRWNMFVLAQDDSGARFGQNIDLFGSVREVFGLPAIPRFLRVGDDLELGVVVHNNTKDDKDISVEVVTEGILINGNYTQNINLDSNSSQRVFFDATASDGDSAKITFYIKEGSKLYDGITKEIEILPFGLETVQSFSNSVAYSAIEEFDVPAGAVKDFGELKVEVYSSLIGLVNRALSGLLGYEHNSASIISSKVMPLVYRYKFATFINDNDLAEASKNSVIRYLDSLKATQNEDGGWGLWNSNIFETTRVMESFGEAKRAGIYFNDEAQDRGVTYIINELNKKGNVYGTAYILYVLELNSSDQTGRIQTLYESRASISDYSKAMLISAMSINSGKWSTFINQLKSELVLKADLGSRRIFWSNPQGGWYTGNDYGTTAVVLRAFNKIDPHSPVADLAIRYLTQLDESGPYISFNERLKITALIENIIEKKVKLRESKVELKVNDTSVASGVLEPKIGSKFLHSVAVKDLNVGENKAELVLDKGGNNYYNMVLTTLLPFSSVEEMSNELAISREILDYNGNLVTNNSFKVGESYLVRLTIAAPNIRRNLMLEDFLPAGFESVNESLKNESRLTDQSILNSEESASDNNSRFYYVNNAQMYDSKTTLEISYLPRGVFEYTYTVRATVPGEFKYRPAHIYELNSPDIRGNTSGALITITN